jgi:preprotein translocase subunit SecF
MEIFKNTNFDFLGKKWPFIIASLVVTAIGLVSLVAKGGPRYGIDFTGGNEAFVKFRQRPPVNEIRAAIAKRVTGDVSVVEVANSQDVIINVEQQREEKAQQQVRDSIVAALRESFGGGVSAGAGGVSAGAFDFNNAGLDALVDRLRIPLQQGGVVLSDSDLRALCKNMLDFRDGSPRSGLLASIGDLSAVSGVTPQVVEVLKRELAVSNYVIKQFQVVGPKIGAELQQKAILATLYSLAGMLVYIAFRFEWVYGLAAVVAVFHDTIITLGIFSVLDKEISLTVVAALLTLIGYSMNDTIVVFDRIRENLKLNKKDTFEKLVNDSINQTLSRTIMVSGLTFLTALSLWIFGGPVLNGFSLALVIGIIVGTYSSIFIASPLLILWRDFAERRAKPAPAPVKVRASGR